MELLKKMLKEQLCCLGRVFARHEVPDDVIWEVVKGFDLIYQKTKQQAENSANTCLRASHRQAGTSNSYLSTRAQAGIYKMEPHPGLTYLLEKIEK